MVVAGSGLLDHPRWDAFDVAEGLSEPSASLVDCRYFFVAHLRDFAFFFATGVSSLSVASSMVW